MQNDIVSSTLQWLNTNSEYAWLITFLISAGESIAVIGTIVPGSITMTALGALAGSGIIPLWSTVLWAFLGAIVGDGVSYAIGYHFKHRLHEVWPFKKNLKLLGKGEYFFKEHGGMSVFLGRFIGPIRALIPVIAGAMGMKPFKFLLANIASAAGWTPAYMLPGILLGAASLELPPDIATRVMLIFVFWTLLILLCLWLIRKIPLMLHYFSLRLFDKAWRKIQKSRTWRVLTKPIQHYEDVNTPLQFTLIFYFLVMCGIFIALSSYIHIYGSPNIFINQSIYHFFRGIYTENGKEIMIYITLLGQKQVLIPVACMIIGWLLYEKRYHIAFHGLALFLLTAASIVFLKQLVHSFRPWGVLNPSESFSFPSGHVTLTTTFYIALMLLINNTISTKSRKLLYILFSAVIFAVSISRLYLGAHWFTDVIGAWVLSAALLILITISYGRKKIDHPKPKNILTVSVLSLAIIYAACALYYIPRLQMDFTQLDYPSKQAEMNSWWGKQDQNFLPEWPVSLFGFPSQPINIEWLGDIATIEATLKQADWKEPPQRDWMNVLFRLSGIQSAEHLPLISPLYLDKQPVLVLIKSIPADKKLMVLRIWKSNIILQGHKTPLWVGVVGLVPRTYGWLSRHYKMDIEVTPSIIFDDKHNMLKMNMIRVTIPKKAKNVQHKILLIR